MSTAVSFERRRYEYEVRFAYDPDLVAMVKTVPSFARSWDHSARQWTVDAYYARRIAEEMAAHSCLITGPEAEPEKRKQQRNGDMYCSSRCRPRFYRRRSSTPGAYGMGFADMAQELL